MTGPARRDDQSVEAAINWMVELCSGAISDRQRRAFTDWLAADPSHEEAWVRLQEGLMPCGVASRQGLPSGRLTRGLAERRTDRRSVVAGLAAMLGFGAAGAVVANRFVPLGDLLADHVTRTGEQGSIRLADGSEVVLAPRTALDVDVAQGRRGMRLVEGEVILRVAEHADPFRLEAGPLRLAAEAGSYMVERRAGALVATGLLGTGRLAFGAASDAPIGRGERVALKQGRPQRQTVDVADATAWLDGVVVATDRPVAAIVHALRPYFAGVIRLDPAVAEIRATGVFPLRRPHEALEVLAASLDLSMTSVAHYWITIGPGAGSRAG